MAHTVRLQPQWGCQVHKYHARHCSDCSRNYGVYGEKRDSHLHAATRSMRLRKKQNRKQTRLDNKAALLRDEAPVAPHRDWLN